METKGTKAVVKWIVTVLMVLFIVSMVSSGFYKVNEQQNAVVTMFGKVVKTNSAGLYFKIPYIQQVRKVDITTHGVGIGYDVSGSGQNFEVPNADGIMITSDFNFLDIDFYLEFKVSDPVAYLYNADEPEEIMTNIALASIRSTVVNYTVDEAMTTGKSQIQTEIKELMKKELEKQNIGMQVVNITIQDSEPPTQDITQAFKMVETAKQGADTAKNNALKYQNEQIPAAEAEADMIIQTAEANKAARIAEAEGQVARFNQMYGEYKINPLITKKRMFYETMESTYPNLKIIITDGETQTMLPLDSFTDNTNILAEDSTDNTEEMEDEE